MKMIQITHSDKLVTALSKLAPSAFKNTHKAAPSTVKEVAIYILDKFNVKAQQVQHCKSQRMIADALGLSVRTVARAVAALRDLEILEVINTMWGNVYDLGNTILSLFTPLTSPKSSQDAQQQSISQSNDLPRPVNHESAHSALEELTDLSPMDESYIEYLETNETDHHLVCAAVARLETGDHPTCLLTQLSDIREPKEAQSILERALDLLSASNPNQNSTLSCSLTDHSTGVVGLTKVTQVIENKGKNDRIDHGNDTRLRDKKCSPIGFTAFQQRKALLLG